MSLVGVLESKTLQAKGLYREGTDYRTKADQNTF